MAKIYDASKLFGHIKTTEDAQFWANHTQFLIRVMFSNLTIYTDVVDHEDFSEGSTYSYYPMQGYFEKVLNTFKEAGHLTVQELDSIMGTGNIYSALENFMKDFMTEQGTAFTQAQVNHRISLLHEEHGKYLERLNKLSKINFNG